MPNIAQQDYNRIYIANLEAPLTTQEKYALQKAVDNGIIMDTIIETEGGRMSRVVAASPQSKLVFIYVFSEMMVYGIQY